MFMPRGGNRVAAHNRILEEPAMAKARSLVGLDVHATKIVAAVLDAETGEIAFFSMTADIEKTAAFCAALPRPIGSRTRPVRRGTASPASSPSGASNVSWRHRRRSPARPGTG